MSSNQQKIKIMKKNISRIQKIRFSQNMESITQATSIHCIKLGSVRNIPISNASSVLIKHKNQAYDKQQNTYYERKTIRTFMNLKKQQHLYFSQKIKQQLNLNKNIKILNQANNKINIRKVRQILNSMIQSFFTYKKTQAFCLQIYSIIKNLSSSTLLFRTYVFFGILFYQFTNYSLSLYFFDKALKSVYEQRVINYSQYQSHFQLITYKYICQIFLTKNKFQQSKLFGLKLLRMSWYFSDIDKQIMAYDLLGKIYMQIQQPQLSCYLHHRMTKGQKQIETIKNMSNNQMQIQLQKGFQILCYQNIQIFVQQDKTFNSILEGHYTMKSRQFAQQQGIRHSSLSQRFVFTHHSPSRMVNKFHIFERKMIQPRQSKQIHFLKLKDCKKIKNLIKQYLIIIQKLSQKAIVSIENDLNRNFKNLKNYESAKHSLFTKRNYENA